MFIGLEHTAIASPSPAKLAQWYVDHLGFRHTYNYEGNYFVRAANDAIIEIIQAEGPRAEQKDRDPGIRHLAIQVSDFDGAYQSLKAHGVHFTTEPYMLRTNRLVFFTDCDGNLVHLIHRETPLP